MQESPSDGGLITMVYYKTIEQIDWMRQSALLVSRALTEVAAAIRPGLPTRKLDELADACIRDHGGEPAFKGFKGFPWTLCISTNDEVVHGMPSDREIQPGDVLSIDCGVKLNGYYGDSAYTFLVGEGSPEVISLLTDTKASLFKGIEQAIAGNRIGDIGFAIQQFTEKERGYGVVRELVGHGLGRNLHEDPQVPNYGRRGKGLKMQEGLVLAIEPMITLGTREVVQREDGWTVATADGSVAAHYEHDVVVCKGAPDVLSSFAGIEQAERSNPELTAIDTMELVNG